jgi:hypothetical protein
MPSRRANAVIYADNSTSQRKKFRWLEPGTRRQISAGGVLFHDDFGVWVIGEMKTNRLEYTDPGGKYQFEDGDIYATMAREIGEETYHTIEISSSTLRALSHMSKILYVNDNNDNKPIYMCMLVHVKLLINRRIDPDPQKFLQARRRILKENPTIPPYHYAARSLKYIPFSDLIKYTNLSYRLKRVCQLVNYFKNDVIPCDKITP